MDLVPANTTAKEPSLRRLRARELGNHIVGDVRGKLSHSIENLDICKLLIAYSRISVPTENQIPEDTEQLLNLPIELFKQLEVPVTSTPLKPLELSKNPEVTANMLTVYLHLDFCWELGSRRCLSHPRQILYRFSAMSFSPFLTDHRLRSHSPPLPALIHHSKVLK